MKYSLVLIGALAQLAAGIALISTHLPACAAKPKAPAPKEPIHRGAGRRIEQPREPKSPTHRGDGRRETKVSGKDFCDAKCGGPDAPQGTGTRYGIINR